MARGIKMKFWTVYKKNMLVAGVCWIVFTAIISLFIRTVEPEYIVCENCKEETNIALSPAYCMNCEEEIDINYDNKRRK